MNEHPLVIAHRGFPREAPENTIPAFEKALEAGAHMIELDVRSTSDGHPVVFHDYSLYRTTSQRGLIEMLTLRQVEKLDVGAQRGEEFHGTRIPQLEEALIFARNRVPVNIELKTPGIERKIVNLIKKHSMTRSVLVSSFRYSSLKKIAEMEPEIRLGVIAVFLSGFDDIVKDLNPYSVHLWSPLLLSKIPIDHAHSRGLRVYAWPVNSVRQFRVLSILGVDAMITEMPDRLVQALPPEQRGVTRKTLPPRLKPKKA
ncbi:MAG: glycerophosphodiester phosphodiesterase family protein [bacterium]